MQPLCQIILCRTHMGWLGFAMTNEAVLCSLVGADNAALALGQLAQRLSRFSGLDESHAPYGPDCLDACRDRLSPHEFWATYAEVNGSGTGLVLGPWREPPSQGLPGSLIHSLHRYFRRLPECFSEIPVFLDPLPAFTRRVLQECRKIPFGETSTYGQLARQIGVPQAARAVGQALARNPIPLIVPCHRVVASTGDLRGFSAIGGLTTKSLLLRWEKAR